MAIKLKILPTGEVVPEISRCQHFSDPEKTKLHIGGSWASAVSDNFTDKLLAFNRAKIKTWEDSGADRAEWFSRFDKVVLADIEDGAVYTCGGSLVLDGVATVEV